MTDRAQTLPSLRSRMARRRGERGAAIVEFALVAVIFAGLLFGIIAFGMALAVKQTVTNATAAGARAAVGSPTEADAMIRAVAQADQAMSGFSGSYDAPVATVDDCDGTPGRCITVTISAHPVATLGLPVPDPLMSTAVVQIS